MTHRRRALLSMPLVLALVMADTAAAGRPLPAAARAVPAAGPASVQRTPPAPRSPVRRGQPTPRWPAPRGQPADGQPCEELEQEPGGDGGPSARAAAGGRAQGLPPGVTQAAVQRGRQIYLGRGYCYTCHGRDGKGIPGVGSDLTDREWSRTAGTLESLMDRIRCGVPAERSPTGLPMPPRGGGRLTEDDLRAVAAFVWTLSRSEDA